MINKQNALNFTKTLFIEKIQQPLEIFSNIFVLIHLQKVELLQKNRKTKFFQCGL